MTPFPFSQQANKINNTNPKEKHIKFAESRNKKKFNTKTFGKNNKNNELNLEKFCIDVKQDKNIKVIKMLNLLISNNLIY